MSNNFSPLEISEHPLASVSSSGSKKVQEKYNLRLIFRSKYFVLLLSLNFLIGRSEEMGGRQTRLQSNQLLMKRFDQILK